MIWDELNTIQLDKLDRNLPVFLLLAATEQHGPHLPLATDRLIGEHFLKCLNNEIPNKVLIVPTISIGCSSHHMDFSGTLTLKHSTFSKQVEDIVRSVIKHGFTSIILFNSHGGNQAVGQVLVEKLGFNNPKKNILMVTWWKLASESLIKLNESGKGGVGHACEFETSLMQLIAPQLVDQDRLEIGKHNPTFPWAEGDMLRGATASLYRSTKEMTTNGVFGNPKYASIEKGEKITKLIVNGLKNIVTDLLNSKN